MRTAAPREVLGRGRARETGSALERDCDEPPRRDTGEGILAWLRRADEQRQLLLQVARREVRVAAEDQGGGAVVPGELLVRDRELVVRHGGDVDARALDVDATTGAPDAYLKGEGL